MSRRDLLQQILSASDRLLTILPAPPKSHLLVPLATTDIPPLRLIKFISQFQSEMQRNNLLLEITQAAYLKAKELAASYQNSYERTCRRLMAHPTAARELSHATEAFGKIRTTFENLYLKRDLPRFLQDAIQAQNRYFCHSRPRSSHVNRPVFQHV